MDKANITYGTDPLTWRTQPIPAPRFASWLRIIIDDRPLGERANPFEPRVVIERHPWAEEPPPAMSLEWRRLGEHTFAPASFQFSGQAIAWVMGLLYGAAWLEEFAAEKQPQHSD